MSDHHVRWSSFQWWTSLCWSYLLYDSRLTFRSQCSEAISSYARWYVSNVSIIFDCSMLLYYLFWMSMGFILHIYIIFGTNLLIGGPAHIVVFLPISVFQRKGTSNGVQTEWNLREHGFWNECDPENLEWKSRSNRGLHEIGGRPPIEHAPCLVGPSGVHRRTSSSYIYLRTPKTSRAPQNTISTTVTFCIRKIPSWSLRRRSAGGGIDHGGLLHQHHSPSDELWVVYHRPSGPYY